MTPKNKHQPLSRWLSGDATYTDESMLDRASQEDAFLAEAMEGYRSLPEENHLERVTKIKAKLRQKSGKKAGLIWVRVAAALAFLLIALFGIQQWNESMQKENISQVQKTESPSLKKKTPTVQETKEESEAPRTSSDIEKESEEENKSVTVEITEKLSPAKAKEQISSEKISPEKKRKPITPIASKEELGLPKTEAIAIADETSAPVTKPNPPPSANNLKKDSYTPEKSNIDDIATMDLEEFDLPEEQIIDNNDSESVAAGSVEDSQILKNVSGFIRDKKGNPIGGATIFAMDIPSSATLTNFDGSFLVRVDPKIDRLQISHEEHSPLAIELGGENYIEVSMSEAQEVSTAAAKKSSKNRAESQFFNSFQNQNADHPSIGKAQPKNGFGNFKKYIQQNLKYPDAARKNNINGLVQIQFKINKNGILSDFKIRKSLGFGCDEEAIRILKDGPKWKAAVDTVTIYEIEFKNW